MKVGITVTSIELLQEFYTVYSKLVSEIDAVRDYIVSNGRWKGTSMGSSSNSGQHRFEVSEKDVRFYFSTNTYDNQAMYMEYRVNLSTEKGMVAFFDVPSTAQIDFGANLSPNSFMINVNELKTMQYPVQEDEYFQRLTQKELPPVEVYDKFINDEKGYQSTLLCTFSNPQNNDDLVKILHEKESKITSDLMLVIHAYKSTIR